MRSNADVASHLNGLVHLDTQKAPDGIDLTVDAVFRTMGHGQLDFGGSEFQAAPREKLSPVLDDPDDDYAWWTLEEGAYVIRYNESLVMGDTERATLSPLPRLLHAGAHHTTVRLHGPHDPMEMLLVVTRMGCRIKENARVSRLTIKARSGA